MRRKLVLPNPLIVNDILKEAGNCNLKAEYKIGVYGEVKQDEIFIEGGFINWIRFLKNYDPLINDVRYY